MPWQDAVRFLQSSLVFVNRRANNRICWDTSTALSLPRHSSILEPTIRLWPHCEPHRLSHLEPLLGWRCWAILRCRLAERYFPPKTIFQHFAFSWKRPCRHLEQMDTSDGVSKDLFWEKTHDNIGMASNSSDCSPCLWWVCASPLTRLLQFGDLQIVVKISHSGQIFKLK